MSRRHHRIYLSLLMLSFIAVPRARALLMFNDGKDQVFVSATYSIGYDSNVFTSSTRRSSFTQSASFSADYTRRAGVIGVNASVSIGLNHFNNLKGQDFANPDFSLAFNKGKGRTTGSLSFDANRTTQPDPNVNQRTTSWNYSSALALRYPVNDRYYFTSATDVGGSYYSNKALFADLNTYAEGVNINYVYSSKLDLQGGYRIRVSDTSKDTKSYDHSITMGASGSILPKLSGSLSVGVQQRNSETAARLHETFNAMTAGVGLNWPYTRTLSFTGGINKDFSTTASNISIDTTYLGVHANLALTRKYFLSFGTGYTETAFLGEAGQGRKDYMWEFDGNLGFAFTTKVRANINYTYTINRSNESNSEFTRESVTLTITARY